MVPNDSGMNSCRTDYYSASYFGFLNFTSILELPSIWGNYLCRHVELNPATRAGLNQIYIFSVI